jgi:Rrf2 family protein
VTARSKKRIVSASELVRELNIPRPFLRKILQVLNRKKILKSYKGKGGGFELKIAPDRIFLTDLIRIFQGPFELNECAFKKRACPNRDMCILKRRMDRLDKDVRRELGSITITSLIG